MLKTKYFNRCSGVSFLTAFITLATQILVFRIISAKLHNHYAFLVISITMLGFALSGVILAYQYRFIKYFRKYIHLFIYGFVISLILSTIIFYHIPINQIDSWNKIAYIKYMLYFISIANVFVVPFIFCGLILGALLSHKQLPTKKIYCFDLVGSALGALLIVFLISFIGVEKSLLILSALFMIGINIILPFRSKKYKCLFIILLAFLFVLYPNYSKVFKMKFPAGSWLTGEEFEVEHFEWDPITRIEVSKYHIEKNVLWDSSLIGPNKTFHSYIKKAFTQNNNAGTLAIHYDGNLDSLKGIEETMYHSAYRAISIPSPKVLVIGVGGGTDILTALYSKASHVTGVEINGAIHKIIKKVYKDYFKNWVNHPKVDLVHDEGRHYLSKTDELYDIIQLTGVDSYSGTMASANIFSENYLYTREAVRLYYQKLTEQGIVSIITLEFPITPREALRMLTTVVAELRDMGVQEPYKHIAMITSTQETLTALLFKRTPFSETEIQKLKDWTAGNPNIYFSSTNDLKPGQNNIYQVFLKLNDKLLEKAFITVYPYNIMPTIDDQPFFFRYTKWMHLKIKGSIPVFEYNILILLFVLTFVSWILIYLPLKHLLRMNIHIKGIKRYIIIFSSIGLGYLFIEIAYMQKLGLFLGHPNLAISVVLSGLLLSTGIGSIYSKSIIQKFKNTKYVTYGLSLLILFEYIFILPYLNILVGMNGLIKGAMAFLLLLPIGVILGIYMPTAIDQLKMVSPKYVPWGWGINGIFSVISPILAIAISVTFGINFLLLCSIPLYLVAGYFLYSE